MWSNKLLVLKCMEWTYNKFISDIVCYGSEQTVCEMIAALYTKKGCII